MNVITVSQLNRYMKAVLDEQTALKSIYISGEISNYKYYRQSGHMYFTLKDEASQLKAVMFASYAERLKFDPEDGMKVICRGRVSVYEKSGVYQLYVEDMQPNGLGALNLAFEQLKQRLFEEGVCDESLKKSLPRYPKKIGVATSNMGAAVEDIKNITKRRFPLAELVIVPTLVQGDSAAPDIVRSIKLLDDMADVDVIIVGRGGGSIEDLWAFNTEEVARAVINCKTPIVSAVGHETDYTICDFVSDLRAPTPSAAAELVCPDINTEMNYLSSLKTALNENIDDRIEFEMQKLDDISKSPFLIDFESMIETFKDNLLTIDERMIDSVKYQIENKESNFALHLEKLNVLSPLAVLSRGYSLSLKNGKAVKSIDDVNKNDELKIRLFDGDFSCSVCEVNKYE